MRHHCVPEQPSRRGTHRVRDKVPDLRGAVRREELVDFIRCAIKHADKHTPCERPLLPDSVGVEGAHHQDSKHAIFKEVSHFVRTGARQTRQVTSRGEEENQAGIESSRSDIIEKALQSRHSTPRTVSRWVPRKAFALAPSTRTITSAPGRPSPSKFTVRFSGVRPKRLAGSNFDGPSTSTSTSRPTCCCMISKLIPRWMAWSHSRRAIFNSWGTGPHCFSWIPAAAFGRGEKTNENWFSNSTCSVRSKVASKSSAVSPGNPTMISVVTAIPGRAARKRPSRSRYSATL